MARKTPDPIDKHVGSRIKMRRVMIGMSQVTLGERLDLTFQQVQKYERGINRVGAGRLQKICVALDVPVQFMFEGLPGASGVTGLAPWMFELMGSEEGQRIAAAFGRIADRAIRQKLADLVESIAASVGEGNGGPKSKHPSS
jgi:transcriptional regulator with XRE-family HTH domain